MDVKNDDLFFKHALKICVLKKECLSSTFPALQGPGPGPSRSSRDRAGPIWTHISAFWLNFAHFGFKTQCLTKFLDDSAWFCVEKLEKHGFETKNHRIM